MDSRYIRHGDCNGCGWCCEAIGRFEIQAPNIDDKEYLKVRGFKDSPIGKVISGDFMVACPMHVNNQCGIYETRPRTCREFPSEPNEILHTQCSYWFEDSVTGELRGGKGSPYGITD